MSALDRACPCGICGERTHGPEKCPALWSPLKNEEFFKPAGGRPAGGGEDDERAKKLTAGRHWVAAPPVYLNEDLLAHNYHEPRRVRHLL
jgi:hypothetical protein